MPEPAAPPLDVTRLPAPLRKRLAELLATEKPILHSREAAGPALVAVFFMALLPLGGALLLTFLHVGVVDSFRPAHALLAALGYGAVGALFAYLALLAAGDVAQLRSGLPGGLYILPAGVIEARRGRARVANADRIERWEMRSDAGGGMGLIHVDLVLDDGVRLGMVLFGTRNNLPTAGLDALVQRGGELRAARQRDDRDAIARLSLIPPDDLRGAGRYPASPTPPRSRRLWQSGVAGVLVAAAVWGWVLPAQSLRAARAEGWVGTWNAVERSHPLPWVRAEAERARAALRAAARATVLGRLAPAWRERLAPLIDAGLAAPDRVIVVAERPPAPADVEAATARLAKLAPADARPAPILLTRVSSSWSSAGGPVALTMAGKLRAAWGIDETRGALELEAERADRAAAPRLEIAYTVDVDAVLAGEGDRVFAALALTFSASAVVPGSPPVVLGDPIPIPATTSMEVLRTDMGGLRKRALDSTGVSSIDAIEDSMVYVKQIERATADAADKLIARLAVL